MLLEGREGIDWFQFKDLENVEKVLDFERQTFLINVEDFSERQKRDFQAEETRES